LADQFNTDKNRHTGNRHFYSRIYSQMFTPIRFVVQSLLEIGLCRGRVEGWEQTEVPSVDLWLKYFPFCHVIGIDLTDFSNFNDERFTSFVCDQAKDADLRAVTNQLKPESIDIIIDDGSHSSYDQQLTFRHFFHLLRPGGIYFIEDLDWQPPGETDGVPLTKNLFSELLVHGEARTADPLGISELSKQIASINFFDSQLELARKHLLGGLVAIRKEDDQ
jgi:hypothetical protein